MSRNFPLPGLSPLPLLPLGQSSNSTQWTPQWQCGRGCPIPALGLSPTFPRYILPPRGSQVSPAPFHSVPTIFTKCPQHHKAWSTPAHLSPSAALSWAQEGLAGLPGFSKAHRKLGALCTYLLSPVTHSAGISVRSWANRAPEETRKYNCSTPGSPNQKGAWSIPPTPSLLHANPLDSLS